MTADLYLLRHSIRDMLHPKTLLTAGACVLLPALIAMLIRVARPHRFDPAGVYDALAGNLIFGFLLVILCVVFGTGVISQETEQKTIGYLLTRPLPRWRIAVAKFVAATALIMLTVWAATLALAVSTVGVAGPDASNVWRDIRVLPIGVVAYGGISLMLATILDRPLILGLLYAFVWEGWAARLPGDFEKLCIMAYLRALAPHIQMEQETTRLEEFLLAGEAATIGAGLAWGTLIAVTFASLGLALILFSRREYVSREEAA